MSKKLWHSCKVILLMFLVILPVGCGDREVDLEDTWPLSEGNYWRYELENGHETDELEMEVVGVDYEEAREIFKVRYDYDTHRNFEYYTYKEDGLAWERIDNPMGNYQRLPAQYLIKQPVTEEKEWTWQGALAPMQGLELNYSGTASISQEGFEEIELPIGRYDALKVENNMDLEMGGESLNIRDLRFYVPEIGLAKQEVYENDELELKILLTEYELQVDNGE